MSTFALNPQILPPSGNISAEKHHKSMVAGIIVAILVVIIGFTYYFMNLPVQQPATAVTETPDANAIMRAQVISTLQSTSDVPPTATQKASVISALNKTSTKTTVDERQSVINKLNNQ